MLKQSLGAKLRRYFLRRVVSGPVELTRENYDSERRKYAQQRIGRISIYGNHVFIEDARTALSRLADAYPYGSSLVQRYIHAIEEEGFVNTSKISALQAGAFGARVEKTNAEGKLPATPGRYAAFLVRLAVNRRRALLYAPKSKEADLMAQKKE
jgi:hypothetical protein